MNTDRTDPLRALFELPAHNPSFDSVRAMLNAKARAGSARAADPTGSIDKNEASGPAPAAHASPLDTLHDAPHEAPLLDFCVPVNRHFPLDELLAELTPRLPELLRHYPDYAAAHQQALATIAGVDARYIVPANGSTELITLICQALHGPITTCVPTFGRWTDLPGEHGVPVSFLQRREDEGFGLTVGDVVAHVRQHGTRALVLSNPNNPTGALMPTDDLLSLVERLADLALIVVDESFIDFSGAPSLAQVAIDRPNVIVVKSLGKSIGWHGVRLGYAVAHPEVAADLRRRLPYWNINGIAAFVLRQVAARTEALRESFVRVRSDREHLIAGLSDLAGLRVFPSAANFIYARITAPLSGRRLRDRLLDGHGLLVRECGNKRGSSEQYLRIAVNPPSESDQLVEALRVELAAARGPMPDD